MEFILYNPLSGNGSSKKIAESYAEKTDGSKLVDITGIEDFSSFVAGLSTDDFALITTYDNSSYCKPNPKYYVEILEKFGLKPEECLMV